MNKRIFSWLVFLFLAGAGLLPVLYMVAGSVFAGGRFTLESYEGVLASGRQWTLMANSLGLSGAVALLTLVFGVPLGMILGKTDMPMRRFFTLLFLVPLLVPPYTLAVSWNELVGRGGLIGGILGPSLSRAMENMLFGLPGCALVHFSIFLPIPMLFTMSFARSIDPHLEEAGRLVSGWKGTILGISLPLIRPGVALSALLVFVLSLGEFSVPGFLRFDVFPVESFTQFTAFYDFKAATASAVPLAAVGLFFILAESRLFRRYEWRIGRSSGKANRGVIGLGGYKKLIFFAVSLLALVIVVLPIAVLVIRSGSIETFAEAWERAGESLVRSLEYAVIGATALTLVGFFTGYIVKDKSIKAWRVMDSMTVFLLALPSTVMGIGLIGLWNTSWTHFTHAPPALIIIGYVAKYTALTSRISMAKLAELPGSMEEAARISGAGWGMRMLFIVIPLCSRALAASWIVGYIFSFRDTGITMLVYPPGHETLPVRIFTMMANGSPELISARCVSMVLSILGPAGVLWAVPASADRKKMK